MDNKQKRKNFTDDEIRELILKFLYERYKKKAKGLKTLSAKISEIKKALRGIGIKGNAVARNLDFLISTGWVEELKEPRTVKTPKGFEYSQTSSRYKISPMGIEYFEGKSKFYERSIFQGINVNNISGIVVIGVNNYVRADFKDVFSVLDQLEQKVKLTSELDDEEKLNVISDIQTIKSQLLKTNPDKGIVQKATESISFLGSISGLAELVKKVVDFISQHLHL